MFTIDLIPLGSGSFDIIMGVDWLSYNKAVIICHDKVVENPLGNANLLGFMKNEWRNRQRL